MTRYLLFLIKLYQKFPTSAHNSCRFAPTCSSYTYQAVTKYGIVKGSFLGLKRILRCQPFYRGDTYDPLI